MPQFTQAAPSIAEVRANEWNGMPVFFTLCLAFKRNIECVIGDDHNRQSEFI